MAMEGCGYQELDRPVRGLWQLFGRVLQKIGRQIERWDQLSYQRQQLLEMDEHLLKDIGLSRADAERLAAGRRFWDDPSQSGEQVDFRYRSSDKK